MVESNIATGLLRRLSTLSLSPSLPIAYPNVPYTPNGEAYLRASHIPSTVSTETIDGWDARRGIFQVDVMWPENRGIPSGLAVADEVAAHFSRGLRIRENNVLTQINQSPTFGSILHAPPYMQIPVNIEFVCYHQGGG